MRGERVGRANFGTIMVGSSPHARGTRRLQVARQIGDRFIPACAGNASDRPSPACPRPVHPRMRGERLAGIRFPGEMPGSSPHARGTPRDRRFHLGVDRFIPACAGNAVYTMPVVVTMAVHPRMRGERAVSAMQRSVSSGSSPHARGTLQLSSLTSGVSRFIPACAGNAPYRKPKTLHGPVHPRMRGERAQSPRPRQVKVGSSPHARGTHFQ